MVVTCDLALALPTERCLFRAKRLVTGLEANFFISIGRACFVGGFFGSVLFAYWMRLLMQESLLS